MSVFPPPAPANPPGLSQLAYRRATYAQLLEWMELLIGLPSIPGIPATPNDQGVPVAPPNALQPLSFTHKGYLQALFDAWAVVGDVLTFYQERIANEGFIRTAVQSYSVREMMRTVDHVPLPALSASTTFAFIVKAIAATPLVIPIAKGTAVTATPGGSGAPPVFETSAKLDARVEWNAIAAVVKTDSDQTQDPKITEARITGSGVTALKAGAPIVIAGNAANGGSTSPQVTLTSVIRTVDLDRNTKVATVSWDPPAQTAPAIKAPQYTAFRATAGLFGARAADWSSLPDTTKAAYPGATRTGGIVELPAGANTWSSLVNGSDGLNPLALAYDADGALYALTAQHLLVCDAPAATPPPAWRVLMSDQRSGLLSFAVSGTTLYVGTALGGVRVSRDGGTSWSDVGPAVPNQTPPAGTPPPVCMARLPAVAVRALAIWTRPNAAPVVLAGTDRGLAVTIDDGSPWRFRNCQLGDVPAPQPAANGCAGVVGKDDAPAPVSISSLAVAPDFTGTSASVLAATSASGGASNVTLWVAQLAIKSDTTTCPPASQTVTATWVLQIVAGSGQQLPAQPSFGSVAWGARYAYAGGSGGLYRGTRSTEGTLAWTPCPIPAGWFAAQPGMVAASGNDVAVSSPSPAGIAWSPSGGDAGSWTRPSATTAPAAIALAVGASATAAAIPLGNFPDEWPSFELSGTTVDLERMVPTLPSGGQVLLVDNSGSSPLSALGTITDVQTVRDSSFMQTALVSRLTVTWSWPQPTAKNPLQGFSRRTTRAYFDSRTMQLAPPAAAPSPTAPSAAASSAPPASAAPALSRPAPAPAPKRKLNTVQTAQRAKLLNAAPPAPQLTVVQGSSLTIDGAPAPLPADRPIVVSGKAIRARIVGLAGGVGAGPLVRQNERVLARSFVPLGRAGLDCVALIPIVPDDAAPASGEGPAKIDFLVATSQGVWRLTTDGSSGTWTFLGLGTLAPDAEDRPAIRALALAGGYAIAATVAGIDRAALAPLLALAANAKKDVTVVEAAWNPIVFGDAAAPDAYTTIQGLAYDGATLWAGGDGLWRSGDAGQTWSRVTEPDVPAKITLLQFSSGFKTREPMLVAGTPDGVALRTGAGWSLLAGGLTNTEILSFAVAGEALVCGTRGGGLFHWSGEPPEWKHVPLERAEGPQDVYALTADDASGALYGSLRGEGVFHIDVADALLRPSFYQTGIANDVRDIALAGRALFAASRSATVVASDPTGALGLRDLGTIFDTSYTTSLDAGDVSPALRLELANFHVVLPATVVVQTIAKQRWLIVVDGLNDLLLRVAPDVHAPSAIVVSQVTSYPVVTAPDPIVPDAPSGQPRPWTFALSDGAQGTFSAFADEVQCAPALAADADVAETATVVETVPHAENGTAVLTLKTPNAPNGALQGAYDAATVTVLGNVVAGTHGQTSSIYEVIGSGDASQVDQSFTLARKGITMLPTGPGGEQQPQITVKVRPSRPRSAISAAGSLRPAGTGSDGAVEWSYADDLFEQPPGARVYTVEQDDSGTATVMFGNGTHGRLLPTGSENVIARYRTGSGTAGNLAANTISLMPSKPAGVSGGTNPVAAQGGTAAADPAATRRHARDGLLSVERIVALADVTDYALAYGGFAKAHLRVPASPKQKAYLTLAGMAGAAPDPTLQSELLNAIRADGGAALPIVPRAYRPRAIRIGATLYVGGGLDLEPVEKAARDAVLDRFTFERRELREPVYAAAIVALLQAVPGVGAAELTAMCEQSWSPQVVDVLTGEDEWSATEGELLYQLADDDLAISAVALPP